MGGVQKSSVGDVVVADFAMVDGNEERPQPATSLSDSAVDDQHDRKVAADQTLKIPPMARGHSNPGPSTDSPADSLASSVAPSASTSPAPSRSGHGNSALFSILGEADNEKSATQSGASSNENSANSNTEDDSGELRLKYRSATDLEGRANLESHANMSGLIMSSSRRPRHSRNDSYSSRRSGSTEIPRSLPMRSHTFADDAPGLLPSFPQAAAMGMGTRSRRLSTAIPDEFPIECCPLEKEFRTSSRLPLRRPKQIGEGGYACVKLMRKRGEAADKLFAVKQFRGRDSFETEDDYVKKVKSEYCIAKSCHHPNIIEPVRLCFSHGIWSEVMEYCQNGELFGLLEKRYLTLEDKFCMFKQLLHGVDYLHNHGIAHRDLKPENIMLTRDGCVKIIDFGLSEIFSGPHPSFRIAMNDDKFKVGNVRFSAPAVFGSQPYISPEVVAADTAYDPRGLDVWSCGINFLSMIFGVHPWVKASPDNKNYKIFLDGWTEWFKTHPGGNIEPGSNDYPNCGKLFNLLNNPSLERLILRMLHPNPPQRISISEALLSNVIVRMECCQRSSFEENQPTKIKHDHTPPGPPEKQNPLKEWLHRRTDRSESDRGGHSHRGGHAKK